MSKRFGRNQRRRMRAEIEHLQGDISAMELVSNSQRETIRQQAEAISRVSDVLGGNFAGLSPKEVPTDFIDEVHRLPAMRCASGFGTIQSQKVDLNSILNVLETISPEVVIDKIGRQVHVYLRTRRGDVAYALTEEAMRGVPKRYLAEDIARMTAYYLVERLP